MKHPYYTEEQLKELSQASYDRKEMYTTFLPKTKNQKVNLWRVSSSKYHEYGINRFYNTEFYTEEQAKLRFELFVYQIG